MISPCWFLAAGPRQDNGGRKEPVELLICEPLQQLLVCESSSGAVEQQLTRDLLLQHALPGDACF
ncbi:hypothetical protein RO3G_05549 [Rhizopus delemar RA 99-880]|uniref:Uncharacterized protein n=1 Tax=Rhizopus delemar (strain RA 99-880 / ATCC MYA-4621 / FGSC 9543 / NRRL 43880) TaxID=246409 RepID=I1BXB4_RHIO9|nr:hypothetical protein RO3G_05549 [Rhizopus delemar RA 99-880]|eukprot:EIE80844.1 hypothetical protein RO3G_05549 [Rhizopus delemar RA 99-880]